MIANFAINIRHSIAFRHVVASIFSPVCHVMSVKPVHSEFVFGFRKYIKQDAELSTYLAR